MKSASPARHPKLRPLDIRAHSQNGIDYYLLRDPLQLAEGSLLVPQVLGALLSFCDGTRSARGMADAFHAHYGFQIGHEPVEQMLTMLDQMYLLDNENYHTALEAARAEYRAAPCRPPALAGGSYPADPEELHQTLEEYRRRARNGSGPFAPVTPTPTFGLLSPHIDYPRGGVVYAQVWERAAAAAAAADLAILIGTDHSGGEPFTLTRQHYATPYGVLPTAQDVVDELAAALGEEAAFAGELRHRGEHSLELVAVWLHHMRGRKPIEVVPILVGGFHRFYHNGGSPGQDPQVVTLLDTLRKLTKDRRVIVVASGDLAHVGPAFGQEPLTAAQRRVVHQADQSLIGHMAAGDAEGFYRAIHTIQDAHNVCGVAPIYLTLRLLGEVEGTPAGYLSCPADAANESAVTVGGMIFQG